MHKNADIYLPNAVFFDWEANESADYYRLFISTDKDFAPDKSEGYLVNTNCLALEHLFVGTKYYWQVIYTDISGEGGAGSGSPLGKGVNYVNINGRYYVGSKGISTDEGKLIFIKLS